MSLWSCVDQYAAVNPGVVEEVKLIVLYNIARRVTANSTTNSPVNFKSTFRGNRNWCFSKQISYYMYLFGKNSRDISQHNRPLLLCIVQGAKLTQSWVSYERDVSKCPSPVSLAAVCHSSSRVLTENGCDRTLLIQAAVCVVSAYCWQQLWLYLLTWSWQRSSLELQMANDHHCVAPPPSHSPTSDKQTDRHRQCQCSELTAMWQG